MRFGNMTKEQMAAIDAAATADMCEYVNPFESDIAADESYTEERTITLRNGHVVIVRYSTDGVIVELEGGLCYDENSDSWFDMDENGNRTTDRLYCDGVLMLNMSAPAVDVANALNLYYESTEYDVYETWLDATESSRPHENAKTMRLKGIDRRLHEQVVIGSRPNYFGRGYLPVTTDVLTYDELCRHCDACRDEDGFCRCSCSCSGPYFWETRPDGIAVYKGACNKFYVR